jgi:ATP-dependent Clp protease protease subunit
MISMSEEQKTEKTMPIPVDSVTDQHLFDKRMVALYGEVTGEKCNLLCSRIIALQEFDSEKPITLLIDSPGGDLMASMMVYDLMNLIKTHSPYRGNGACCKHGAVPAQCWRERTPVGIPTARIMMHQPSSGVGGSAEDIRIQVEQHRLTRQIFEELQAENIGRPIEEIHSDSERDRWFTAKQSVEYGIADNIIASWNELDSPV